MSSLPGKDHLKVVPSGADCWEQPEWGGARHHAREAAPREYSELRAILLEPTRGGERDPVAQQVTALMRFTDKLIQMLHEERSLAIETERNRRERQALKDEILERIVGSVDEEPVERVSMTAADLASIVDLCDD
jgi:hypothetical protein